MRLYLPTRLDTLFQNIKQLSAFSTDAVWPLSLCFPL